MPKKRKNPRNAPIDRFIWKEGDLQVTYDPYAEKRRKREDSGNRRVKEESEDSDSTGVNEHSL